jgi:hypothetical protein
MVCQQQSRATSSEHHSEWHSHKARYFRRALLLIGTFILSTAATSNYAPSANKSSLSRRQLMKKKDASNVFLRKGSNSQTAAPKSASKTKLHSVNAARAPSGMAVKGAQRRKGIYKSIKSTESGKAGKAGGKAGKSKKSKQSLTVSPTPVPPPLTQGMLKQF